MHVHDAALSANVTPPLSTPIPLKDLFGYQAFSWPRLSPCNTYYTFLAPTSEGAPTIWIQKISEGSASARPLIPSGSRPITNYTWLPSSTHIAYLADTDGDERNHLYLCNIKTGTVEDISPFSGARVLPYLFVSPSSPHIIRFQCNNRTLSEYDVLEYSTLTSSWRVVEQNPGGVMRWYADHKLAIRARTRCTAEGGIALETRGSENAEWRQQRLWGLDESFTSKALFFSPGDDFFYFADTSRSQTNILYSLNLESQVITPLWQDLSHDVYHEAMLTDILDKAPPHASTLWANNGSLAGFSYFKERLAWHFFDAPSGTLSPRLKDLLTNPSWETWVDYSTPAYLIIGRCSSMHPTEFLLYNKEEDTTIFLGTTRPTLNVYAKSMSRPVFATMPDGLTVHGYLTLPTETRPGKIPLVLKIHGGPWTRDLWTFSSEVQMLASNGFACLQVNYRGSSGYGKEFARASRKQFGTAMVDDVINLMKAVLERHPELDASRIAYTGRSYGGYSALTGGRRYQKLFKAVVSFVPPTDLSFFIKSYPPHWSLFINFFCDRIGHPATDDGLMKDQSPLTHAPALTTPTLIFYGKNDMRVVPEHIERYRKTMHQSSENKIVYFDNEGHFTLREENVLVQWHEVLSFLKKHLQGL